MMTHDFDSFFSHSPQIENKNGTNTNFGTEVTSAQVWWSQIPLSPLQGSSMVPNISIEETVFGVHLNSERIHTLESYNGILH